MNKNIIKLFMSSILLVALAFVLTACGGSKFDKYASRLRSSVKEATTVEANAVFTDKDVVVFKFFKSIVVSEENNAEVTSVTSQLNSNFELVDSTKIEQVVLNKNTLLLIIMKEELFDDVKIENDVLTGTVNKENIKKVFNNKEIEISDNANFTFTFVDKKIESIECTYKTLTLKDVNISIKYTY